MSPSERLHALNLLLDVKNLSKDSELVRLQNASTVIASESESLSGYHLSLER